MRYLLTRKVYLLAEERRWILNTKWILKMKILEKAQDLKGRKERNYSIAHHKINLHILENLLWFSDNFGRSIKRFPF